MNSFYRLKSPTDLADLNDSFSRSSFSGFYLFIDNIKIHGKKLTLDKKSKNYLKTIKSLKKNIILSFDFNTKLNRPFYYSPNIQESNKKQLKQKLYNGDISKQEYNDDIESFELILKRNKDKIKELKNLEKEANCISAFDEIHNAYLAIKKYLEYEGLDRFMKSSNRKRTKIIGFEVPIIANFPIEESTDPYLKSIQESINKINSKLVILCKKKSKDFIYPLTLMTKDLEDKNVFFNTQFEYLKEFKTIIIWIIDSNELYSSREKMQLYFNFIDVLRKKYQIYVKYIGIKQLQKYKKSMKNVSIIFREDAYSGYNINIRRSAKHKKTRNLLDPNDIKHKNDKDLLKMDEDSDFHCSCSFCSEKGIKTYKDVINWFYSDELINQPDLSEKLSPKRNVKDEEEYKFRKLRRYQAMFRKIHNFETADSLIFLKLDAFIRKYPDIAKKIDLR